MDNQNNKNNKNNKQGISFILLVTVITSILVIALFQFQGMTSAKEITYNKFLKMVDDGEVRKVQIQSDKIMIVTKKDKDSGVAQEYYTGVVNDDDLTKRLEKAGVEFKQEIPDTTSAVAMNVILTFLPIAFFVGMIIWMTKRMSKGGGMMGIGKSNAKMYVEKQTGVTFKDVAGQDEAKESLQEVVDFLHNPGKYTSVGAKLPKGALLVGPPGTGKTLLAKAVAGEAKVPFFSLSGSAFVEMYVGVGASRVRDLFKQAQQMAPCIIFIDEIDAIGKSRDNQMGGNDEREQTLNQLLAEMDGFESNKGLVLLAATNRPEILDPALLRPGRFDRRIIVEKPDLKGRVEVLKVHSKDVKMDETVNLEEIALATSGAVGSDLANMINEAAINAVKHGRNAVCQSDLFEAVEVVLVGKEKKDRIMSKEERRIVSYHEVGHALVSALQKDAEPAQKIGDLYNMAMDSVTLNKQGAEPVKAMLDKIAGMKDKSEIVPMMTEMAHIGIGTYFHSYVYADPKNSSLNIFQMGQGGINLGEKEYYLDTDSITQNIREQYKLYIGKLFQLAGFSEADAQQKVADVMELETAIAKVSRSATELRDPEANYHKMSFDELKKTSNLSYILSSI